MRLSLPPIALLLWPITSTFLYVAASSLTPPPVSAPGPSSSASVTQSSSVPSASSSVSSSGNASSSATPTSSAMFPSLSGYSTCVVNCLGLAVAQVGCNSLVEVQCFCPNATKFAKDLLNCTTTTCNSTDTQNAEQVAQLFCNVASPSVSLSFPTNISSATASSASSSHSNSSSSASATKPGSMSSTGSAAPTSSQTGASGAVGFGFGLGGMTDGKMVFAVIISMVLGGVGVLLGL